MTCDAVVCELRALTSMLVHSRGGSQGAAPGPEGSFF
jgi:hypothetical protein